MGSRSRWDPAHDFGTHTSRKSGLPARSSKRGWMNFYHYPPANERASWVVFRTTKFTEKTEGRAGETVDEEYLFNREFAEGSLVIRRCKDCDYAVMD